MIHTIYVFHKQIINDLWQTTSSLRNIGDAKGGQRNGTFIHQREMPAGGETARAAKKRICIAMPWPVMPPGLRFATRAAGGNLSGVDGIAFECHGGRPAAGRAMQV